MSIDLVNKYAESPDSQKEVPVLFTPNRRAMITSWSQALDFVDSAMPGRMLSVEASVIIAQGRKLGGFTILTQVRPEGQVDSAIRKPIAEEDDLGDILVSSIRSIFPRRGFVLRTLRPYVRIDCANGRVEHTTTGTLVLPHCVLLRNGNMPDHNTFTANSPPNLGFPRGATSSLAYETQEALIALQNKQLDEPSAADV